MHRRAENQRRQAPEFCLRVKKRPAHRAAK